MSGFEQITGRYWPRCPGGLRVTLLASLLLANPAMADTLKISVRGLQEPLQSQISSRVASHNVSNDIKLSPRRLRQSVASAEREVKRALYPFGFYHAVVTSTLEARGENAWQLDLQVDPGPPVTISAALVELLGEGAQLEELRRWKKRWPLVAGQILDQTVWEAQKQSALELAEAAGYLGAAFTQHSIEADLERNEARILLSLETGPQAVMGSVTFEQDAVDPEVLESLPRFKPGQAYDSWLLEKFRLDIWRTGYFKDVEIIEQRRLEESPPRVNLLVKAEGRNRNTYQGSLGYGTDSEIRTQILWTRHLLSSRGDSLDTGLGWQQRNKEYSFKSIYRLPRRVNQRKFWVAEAYISREDEEFAFKPHDDEPEFIELTNGDVTDYSLKLGNLVVRDLAKGYQQIFETWYAQYALEKNTFSFRQVTGSEQDGELLRAALDPFRTTDSSIALGINWDWPVIRGKAFRTYGHHERAWIFTANEAWGSGLEFTQAYLSSNWTRLLARRWKLLLRGEIAYSDAKTRDMQLDINGQLLDLSVTELPSLYRFKTGGSRTVRGYAFESLSNNGIGSNHIVTASAEIEWNFREDWSAAVFYDLGNAFNHWNQADLKQGAGVGIRWYSIAGPIRLDIAQALAYDGHPWLIHFTIGTPLL